MPFKLKRRSNFTLLEILICFAFVSLILVVLFTHFRSTATLSLKTEQVKRLSLAREHAYERLCILFAKVASSEEKLLKSKESCFFTEDPSSEKKVSKVLYFAFDNEADPEKDFSSFVRVKLFLDEAKNLCLETSPVKKEKQMPLRKEVLLSHVEDLHFTFYKKTDDPNNASSLEDFIQVGSYGLSEKSLPYFFKLSLKLSGSDIPLEFSFFLNKNVEPIRWES